VKSYFHRWYHTPATPLSFAVFRVGFAAMCIALAAVTYALSHQLRLEEKRQAQCERLAK
jgi:hypothetical protein